MGLTDFIRERRYLNNVSSFHNFMVHARAKVVAF